MKGGTTRKAWDGWRSRATVPRSMKSNRCSIATAGSASRRSSMAARRADSRGQKAGIRLWSNRPVAALQPFNLDIDAAAAESAPPELPLRSAACANAGSCSAARRAGRAASRAAPSSVKASAVEVSISASVIQRAGNDNCQMDSRQANNGIAPTAKRRLGLVHVEPVVLVSAPSPPAGGRAFG